MTSKGWRVLLGAVKPQRRRVIVLAVVTVIGAVLEAGLLVLLTGAMLALAQYADSVGPVMDRTLSMATVPWVAAGLVAGRFILHVIAVNLSSTVTARVMVRERDKLARAYLGTKWGVQNAEPSGRLQELMGPFVTRVSTSVTAFSQGLTALLNLSAFVVTGFVLQPVATLVMAMVLVLLALVLVPLRRRIHAQSRRQAAANLEFSRQVAEFGTLGLEMRSFGVREQFRRVIEAASNAQVTRVRRVQRLSGLMSPIYTGLAYAAIVGAVVVVQLLGELQLSALGAVMLLLLRSLSYGQQLVTVQSSITSMMPFLERLEDDIDRYRRQSPTVGHVQPAGIDSIVLDNVRLSYPGADSPALESVSFTLSRGEALGIIGESGAGKSTLAQILLRLRAPSSGTVTVDGVEAQDLDHAWWASRTAFVAQDAQLISGTVLENIRFFREGIDEVTAKEAARQANVLADIERLPSGFATHLGERGSQLSGGQRQRLSIARALAGRPEFLIMDEPTSALDGESEALIRDALVAMHGSITMVLIAHRLSTLQMCDRIAVIEAGRLTALDTPRRLWETSAFYRRAITSAGLEPVSEREL